MAWYWLILGCMLSGLLGFFICAALYMASEADNHMMAFSDQIKLAIIKKGTRAERRRQWRQSWDGYHREV